MKWKVESKYYDSGEIEAELKVALPEDQPGEVLQKGYILFIDIFPSKEVAQLFYSHTKTKVFI